MTKILLVLAFIFLVVYSIYCMFVSVLSKSDEEQITFFEAFLRGLSIVSICFLITASIVSFIVINF